jgi:flagellar basal body-associated protein FliL
MSFFGIVVGMVGMIAIGLISYTPERAAHYEKDRRVEAACDQMMSDSALGDERRLTRSICDKLKAKVEAERYSESSRSVKQSLVESRLQEGATIVTVAPFLVNLAQEGHDQYLQTQFNLKVDDPAQAAFLYRKMSLVRSRVLLLLAEKKPSEIISNDGQRLLAHAIVQAINTQFENEADQPRVTDLVFTTFKID